VLSTLGIPEGVRGLLALLSGSHASAFCVAGRRELLVATHSQSRKECFGAPALRPSDFVPAFDQLVKEIRAYMTPLS